MRGRSSLGRGGWSALACVAAAGLLFGASARGQAVENAAVKPVPRSGSWMEMHRSFLDRAKEGEIDLLFLGDSITQGWDDAVWKRYYAPRKAANFGIGGDRTEHVLWRIQNGELDAIRPRVVVLMIGTNNVGRNSAAEIADGIKAIVEALREKLPKARVLLLGVFPRGETPDADREKLEAVNDQVAGLDDRKHVTFLDIGKRFLNEDRSISAEIMPDYLHLSRKGYRIWADAMEPTLWSLLDEETVKEQAGK